MLYISRLVVSLTHVQSIMAGKLSTQMLMSVGVALVLSLLFAVPALLCVQRDCSPLAHRTLGTLYACNFIFLAGINVSRFAYFASARLNPETKSWGFALLILLFAVYGALVGLQGLSRFSGFAFCLIVLVVAVVLGFNVQHFQWFSLFPPGSNTVGEVVQNGRDYDLFGAGRPGSHRRTSFWCLLWRYGVFVPDYEPAVSLCHRRDGGRGRVTGVSGLYPLSAGRQRLNGAYGRAVHRLLDLCHLY